LVENTLKGKEQHVLLDCMFLDRHFVAPHGDMGASFFRQEITLPQQGCDARKLQVDELAGDRRRRKTRPQGDAAIDHAALRL
jgi:hypothetical protein